MSVVYATVNGRLVQENRGGNVTRYVADTLGSVIQTRDASGNQTSSTTYWPFGEVRTSSGANPSPWGFCGTWGYFKDAATRLYVRARFYRPDVSRWMTVDPLWPGEQSYAYLSGQPVSLVDNLGLSRGGDLQECINSWQKLGYSPRLACVRCKAAQNYKGGYDCNCLVDKGVAVPKWVPPTVVGVTEWPFGHMMDSGDAICNTACQKGCPSSGPFVRWCQKLCVRLCGKIRSGGCSKLLDYCSEFVREKRAGEVCWSLYDSACLGDIGGKAS